MLISTVTSYSIVDIGSAVSLLSLVLKYTRVCLYSFIYLICEMAAVGQYRQVSMICELVTFFRVSASVLC